MLQLLLTQTPILGEHNIKTKENKERKRERKKKKKSISRSERGEREKKEKKVTRRTRRRIKERCLNPIARSIPNSYVFFKEGGEERKERKKRKNRRNINLFINVTNHEGVNQHHCDSSHNTQKTIEKLKERKRKQCYSRILMKYKQNKIKQNLIKEVTKVLDSIQAFIEWQCESH